MKRHSRWSGWACRHTSLRVSMELNDEISWPDEVILTDQMEFP